MKKKTTANPSLGPDQAAEAEHSQSLTIQSLPQHPGTATSQHPGTATSQHPGIAHVTASWHRLRHRPNSLTREHTVFVLPTACGRNDIMYRKTRDEQLAPSSESDSHLSPSVVERCVQDPFILTGGDVYI